MNKNYGLSFLQRLAADWGRPNVNGGSNYSDNELRYYLRNYLDKYDDFIPTDVLRDAWRGARIKYAAPWSDRAPTQYDEEGDIFKDMVREAIDTRLNLRGAPAGTKTPTGALVDEIWGGSLTPREAILKQIKLGEQQASGAYDFYPPID